MARGEAMEMYKELKGRRKRGVELKRGKKGRINFPFIFLRQTSTATNSLNFVFQIFNPSTYYIRYDAVLIYHDAMTQIITDKSNHTFG